MSARPAPAHSPVLSPAQAARLLSRLRAAGAVVIADGPAPWRAVPWGDGRRRPVAWVNAALLEAWKAAGEAVRHPKGWSFPARPAPQPIRVATPEGARHAQVLENWMQRLARDLDLPGPLAEAGHRLVADGQRLEAGAHRTSATTTFVDGASYAGSGAEERMLRRLRVRERVRDALAGLSERERAVARAVCLHDLPLAAVAREQRWSEAEAQDHLTVALVKLSRFYGTMPGWGRAPSRRR